MSSQDPTKSIYDSPLGHAEQVLGVLSLLSLIYLIHKTSGRNAAPTITIKIIRNIGITSLLTQIFTSLLSFSLIPDLYDYVIIYEAIYLALNGATILWSFALSYVSYKTIMYLGSLKFEKIIKRVWRIIIIVSIPYIAWGVFLQFNQELMDDYIYLTLIPYVPINVMLPFVSIYLYIRQAVFVRTVYQKKLGLYNLKMGKLVLYPLFELVLFGTSLIVFTLIALSEQYEYIDLEDGISVVRQFSGVIQLVLYLWVRNIASRNFINEEEKETVAEVQYLSDSGNDYQLKRALVDN